MIRTLSENLLFWPFFVTTLVSAFFPFLCLIAMFWRLSFIRNCQHMNSSCWPVKDIPISIIVAAYNEQNVIAETIQALFCIEYENYEIIVVNDGSTDNTLDILREKFDLGETSIAAIISTSGDSISRLFVSNLDSRLIVVDKKHGGKYDALNTGIAIAQYEWFCSVDADTILASDALRRIGQQIQQTRSVIAVAGQVRVGNCSEPLDSNKKYSDLLLRGLLIRVQTIEYIRSFIIERIGWDCLRMLIIVPGAFGVFNKRAVIGVGGYSTGMPSEDVELIIKLYQNRLKLRGEHRIIYSPDAVAWTEAPECFLDLAKQRIRWNYGLWLALYHHRDMFFDVRYRLIGLIALPYLLFCVLLQPVVVAILLIYGLAISVIQGGWAAYAGLLFISFTVGYLLTALSILVDRVFFRQHRSSVATPLLTLIHIFFERSFYAFLLHLFKIQALVVFIRHRCRGYGQWQTFAKSGNLFPQSPCSAPELRKIE